MGRKLFLISVLAVIAAAVAATIASASSVITTGQSGVSVNLPGGSQLPPVGTLPQCSDLKDNDGDGLTDLADPDCSGPLDSTESGTSGTGDTGTTTGGTTTGRHHDHSPADHHQRRRRHTTTSSGGSASGPGNTTTGGSGGTVGGGGQGSGATSTGRHGNRGHIGSSRHGHVRIKPDQDSSPMPQTPERKPNGVPTNANPGLTIANFGAAPAGVPDFVISQFSIPPFLLPIYQACGTQYGIPWQVLAGHQPDRDRLRHQPQRLHRGRRRLDAVHPVHLEGVRRRRQRRRARRPVQPGRRDLRRGPLPQGRRRRQGHPPRRSSPTTTPPGTSTRSSSTPVSTASCPPT